MVDICRNGGYAAILDMNEELAQELVKEIGGGKTKFFETNVLETESIAAAVKGSLEWAKETGKEVGGVIAAAGVSTPAKVRLFSFEAHVLNVLFWIRWELYFISSKRFAHLKTWQLLARDVAFILHPAQPKGSFVSLVSHYYLQLPPESRCKFPKHISVTDNARFSTETLIPSHSTISTSL